MMSSGFVEEALSFRFRECGLPEVVELEAIGGESEKLESLEIRDVMYGGQNQGCDVEKVIYILIITIGCDCVIGALADT